MTKKNHESREFELIHIGKIIEEELRHQERTVTWLSRQIHCDRSNIYDIFSRTSIDTDLLYKLSKALHRDFFTYYSSELQLFINQQFTPPPRTISETDFSSETIIELIRHNKPIISKTIVPVSRQIPREH
ncbi:MAG: hypothetical protein K2K23_00605 [Muribaculaceae bacterium]|nr:hypothetical protein [Muribaculaceae bacterium]